MICRMIALYAMSFVMLSSASRAGEAQRESTQSPLLSVAFQQREVFGVTAEAWLPSPFKHQYWSAARFGLSLGIDAASEATSATEKDHVRMLDAAVGYSVDSPRAGIGRFRSTFLIGGTSMDRHGKSAPERDPTSFGFFDTRQGVALVPPSHEITADRGDDSLMELGVGFRWNFIGGNARLAAGDTEIREMQVYPYLAAHMPL